MKYDVFISYSRKDSAVVQPVVDRLKSEGYNCWMDINGIESGDAFKRVLVQAIKDSKVVIFFSSANSNSTEWTVKEINIAVQLKKPIIPLRLDDTPYDDSILFDLSALDYMPYQKNSIRDAGMEKLLRSVAAKCGDAIPSPLQRKLHSRSASNGGGKTTKFKWWHVVVPILLAVIVGIVLSTMNESDMKPGNVPVKDKDHEIVRQTRDEDYTAETENQYVVDSEDSARFIIQRVDPLNKYNFGAWPIDWDVDGLEIKLQILKKELDKLESVEKELKAIQDTDDRPIGRATLKYS